jgi:hypothetical protein
MNQTMTVPMIREMGRFEPTPRHLVHIPGSAGAKEAELRQQLTGQVRPAGGEESPPVKGRGRWDQCIQLFDGLSKILNVPRVTSRENLPAADDRFVQSLPGAGFLV